MTDKQDVAATQRGSEEPYGSESVDENIIYLPAKIDISTVSQFFEEIKPIIAVNKDVVFNASKIDRITTPGIQILISATKTIKANGGKASISWPSEAFKNIISDLGFSNQLKEWMGSDV